MSGRRHALRTPFAALACSAMILAGCATTTVDETGGAAESIGDDGRELAPDDTSRLEGGVIVDPDAPTTTVPIEGSAADLLPEIGIDMSRLSAQIADDGDEDATIARIEGSWAAIEAEVESTHPELVNSIGATIDMARTAVDTNRPADADKAFSLLNDLVDAYTGDS